ncbi:SHOCT domain-containing protein [Halomicroarcula sp. GCM10025709]|uniref:SHOCT domain-containing protein n=1 Tax=Haloarcula TaxID=2237 RepID=UPI0024C4213F|nr:SHOCT domain-containing protein [Halomicroarcula sp. YJ-61-S]
MPPTDRGLGTLGKLVLGTVVVVTALVVATAILAVLQNLLAALLGLLVTGLLIGGAAYLVYWLVSSITGGESESADATDGATATTAAPVDPVDRLTEQYKRGELTDEEFERRLEAEMTDVDQEIADLEAELE